MMISTDAHEARTLYPLAGMRCVYHARADERVFVYATSDRREAKLDPALEWCVTIHPLSQCLCGEYFLQWDSKA